MVEYTLKPREYRIGIILGAFIYWIFGIVDPFMLPESYLAVWYFRYITMTPGIVLSFLFSYTKYYQKFAKLVLIIVTMTGIIGIEYMVFIAKPTEQGFFGYYSGLVTTLFWSIFIFRFNKIETLLLFLTILIMYDSIAVFSQKLLSYGFYSKEFAWFIDNNFILICSGIVGFTASYMLDRYQLKIHEENIKYLFAKDKAQESDLLKSAFLSNMSHEIRTPLNSIVGFSELLVENDLDEDVRNSYVDMIKKGSDQLLRIIGDIMDISKIESNQIRIVQTRVDLCTLLRECYLSGERFLDSQLKSHIQLKLSIPKEFERLTIKSDPHRITQIIDNLLTNAIKNTNNGYIEFGIAGIQIIAGEEKIQFYCKDTGIGIEKENFELVFQRFGRIIDGRIQRGNGLGLSISKALVELLSGTIWVESEISKGTTFNFNIQLERI